MCLIYQKKVVRKKERKLYLKIYMQKDGGAIVERINLGCSRIRKLFTRYVKKSMDEFPGIAYISVYYSLSRDKIDIGS